MTERAPWLEPDVLERVRVLVDPKQLGSGLSTSFVKSHDEVVRNRVNFFIKYCQHATTAKLIFGKPRVLKRPGGWGFKKDRLFVSPTAWIQSPELPKTPLPNPTWHLECFQSRSNNKPVIPDLCLKHTEEYQTQYNGTQIHTYEFTLDASRDSGALVELVHSLIRPQLQALQFEAERHGKEIEASVDAIVAEFLKKASPRESKKFQEKLVRLLKYAPSIMELDPNVIMTCFGIDPASVESLASFLKTNRADLQFITVADIEEAQNLAKVVDVHSR